MRTDAEQTDKAVSRRNGIEMAEGVEVPHELLHIPEDMEPGMRRWLQAQAVIQSTIFTFGDREAKPGDATIAYDEMVSVLTLAIAMLTSVDKKLTSNRHIKNAAERIAKDIQRTAITIRETGDTSTTRLLDAMGMSMSTVN